ncbi:MAG: DUF2341 domain-containing protein [Elusimicrobiota bacterium]
MWVETNKNDWNDGLTMQTTYYPDTQLQLDWEGSGVGVSSPTAGVPWLEGWKYRRAININNSLSYGLSDYQVWLPTSAFGSNWTLIRSSAQADMDDFRFTPSTASTTIPYWIDSDTVTPKGFWVKVSTITAGTNTIYMYYGNSSASAGQSGDNCFVFFDDFSTANSSKFTYGQSGGSYSGMNYSISPEGYLVVWSSSAWQILRSVKEFTPADTVILTTRFSVRNSSDNWHFHYLTDTVSPENQRCGIQCQDSDADAINDDIGAQTYYSSSGVSGPLSPNFTNYNPSIWYRSSIFKKSSTDMERKLYDDNYVILGSSINSYSGWSATTWRWTCWKNDADYSSWYDFLYVRQYASTEPTISSVGSEAGAYFSTGTYKSNVLDCGAKVVVSSIGWTPSSQLAGSSVNVGLRVSSTSFSAGDATPDWVSVTNGETVNLAGRYVQYMSTFTTTSSTTTPVIEDITIAYKVKPWQEKTVTRTGPNAFGFGGGESWEWEVPAKSGQLVTITAYIRYNTSYGSATKPKITLYNLGISNSAQMVGGADTWEQLTVSGTPNRNGVAKLKIEGYSTAPGAKMFVDDIQISQ